MASSMDYLEKDRIKFGNWKAHLPPSLADLKDMTALEAIGELKKRGHIKSITLVNAPPRTVSTIVSKCLAESPSLNLQGLPVFHEVLKDSDHITYFPDNNNPYESHYLPAKELVARGPGFEQHLGSNVLMGKLLDIGIAEKKGADMVLKIMSHEFQGEDLKALLPYVDNVVSTMRRPGQHIQCVKDKIMEEKAYDYEAVYSTELDMVKPMQKYWQGFERNVSDIDRWIQDHPRQHMRHVVINGDKFLHEPAHELACVSKALNRGRQAGDPGYLTFAPKMLQELKTPVYFSYVDAWGANEIKATRFEPKKRKEAGCLDRRKMDSDLVELCEELEASYGRVMTRHPHAAMHSTDKEHAAWAMEKALFHTNLSHETREHLTAQLRAGLQQPSGNWQEEMIRARLERANRPRQPE